MDGKTGIITWKKIFTDYNLFYFFMMVMYAAGGNEWMQYTRGYFKNPFAMALPIVLTIIFVVKNKVTFNTKFYFLLSLFLIWIFIVIIKFGVHLHFFFILLQLLMAYSVAVVYKLKMFYFYEQIVTKLTIIGLFVWAVNLLFPTFWDSVCPYFAFIRNGSISKYNFFFASVLNRSTQIETWYRNPGFSWEPGMNASLVCFAIFLNLVRTQCQLKRNFNLLILGLGLLSSFSTTGYSCLLGCIIPFFVINKKSKNIIPYTILLVPIVIYILQLDFMTNKIEDLQATDESLYQASVRETETGVYTPQRFDAMMFELMNIQNDPLTGYGLTPDNSYVKTTISEFLYLPGGLLKLYANYGLILGGLLTIFMLYSTIRVSKIWKCRCGWLFYLLYMFLSVSYTFYDIPLFLAFYFIGFWLNTKEIRHE